MKRHGDFAAQNNSNKLAKIETASQSDYYMDKVLTHQRMGGSEICLMHAVHWLAVVEAICIFRTSNSKYNSLSTWKAMVYGKGPYDHAWIETRWKVSPEWNTDNPLNLVHTDLGHRETLRRQSPQMGYGPLVSKNNVVILGIRTLFQQAARLLRQTQHEKEVAPLISQMLPRDIALLVTEYCECVTGQSVLTSARGLYARALHRRLSEAEANHMSPASTTVRCQ
jgi:hypothetical protein